MICYFVKVTSFYTFPDSNYFHVKTRVKAEHKRKSTENSLKMLVAALVAGDSNFKVPYNKILFSLLQWCIRNV